ncbi:hypothetical protein DMN91_012478 [Ooceraea biroi]|uniref:Glutathione S-transferase omega-1 n=1 Tax=Ooceraea biroi TaxID=2015173 RepID=A0A3L8D5H9_OOCBI|nr:pyrimidodiazepine synthase [Ooceraea biroi]RLU15484.1 hypothetical protein DMN91_012478 [Ooceraea biroi]
MSTKHLSTGSVQPPLVPGKIRLYSMRFCPYAQRTHLVLDAKQIPYDVVYINLKSKPEWFAEKNPLGKVPCIELKNGETLSESLITADYLDEVYPENKLYPSNPLAKAKDKLLIVRFDEVKAIMYKLGYQELDTISEVFNEFLTSLEVYERELEQRRTPFFGGNKPGMLDLMIWPWCERADVIRILSGEHFVLPRERFRRLLEWRAAMKDDSAVRVSYQDAETHAKYRRTYLAGAPQYDL